MRDKRQRSLSTQKKQDPNKWYVDIYNLPEHINVQDISFFIWKALQKCRGLKKSTSPIVRSEHIEQINCVRLFFRTKEQTLNCLDLNGILYGQKSFYMKSPQRIREHPFMEAKGLQIKRLSLRVEDSFNKLIIQNLPIIQQYQLVNVLRKYGELKAFQPVYVEKNMPYCYAEFQKNEETEECLAKLNNQKLKSKTISVQRAVMAKEVGSKSSITKVKPKSSLFEKDPYSFYLTFDTIGYFKAMKISCVLLLKNIIANLGQKQFIKNDIRNELQKVGKVTRFVQKDRNIYVEYERVEYAQIAYLILMNRKYEGRSVDVSFYDPINFSDDILI